MARTKATTKTTKFKAKVTKNEEVVQEVQEPVKQEIIVEKRKLNRDDMILVMNYTPNTLLYESRTGRSWEFSAFGDTDEMELSELITMKNAHGRFLREPFLLILDEDAVDYLGLTRLYENFLKPEEIEDLFKLNTDKMEEIVKNAPKGVKTVIVAKAQELIESGKLDSLTKIKVLEEICKIELIDK